MVSRNIIIRSAVLAGAALVAVCGFLVINSLGQAPYDDDNEIEKFIASLDKLDYAGPVLSVGRPPNIRISPETNPTLYPGLSISEGLRQIVALSAFAYSEDMYMYRERENADGTRNGLWIGCGTSVSGNIFSHDVMSVGTDYNTYRSLLRPNDKVTFCHIHPDRFEMRMRNYNLTVFSNIASSGDFGSDAYMKKMLENMNCVLRIEMSVNEQVLCIYDTDAANQNKNYDEIRSEIDEMVSRHFWDAEEKSIPFKKRMKLLSRDLARHGYNLTVFIDPFQIRYHSPATILGD